MEQRKRNVENRGADLRDLTYPLYLYLAEESAETNERLRGGRDGKKQGGRERQRERMRVRNSTQTQNTQIRCK